MIIIDDEEMYKNIAEQVAFGGEARLVIGYTKNLNKVREWAEKITKYVYHCTYSITVDQGQVAIITFTRAKR